MNEANFLEALGQFSASETGQVFRDFLRGHVREMICEVMAPEVAQLCAPKHDPSPSDHNRTGSSSGHLLNSLRLLPRQLQSGQIDATDTDHD